MSPGVSPDEFFDLLGDEYVRRLLGVLDGADAEQSAKELAERSGLSLPTVYRRLGVLRDHGLVAEEMRLSADGNNYAVYRVSFDGAYVSLVDGDLRIRYGPLTPDASTR